jgi:hypothetical protein
MLITKLEAARRHLDSAIELYFDGGDPVAVATLVGAAHIVIVDLTEANKQQSILDRYIRPEHRWKTFENALREPQNFLKHARTDPDGTYDLNPHKAELLLFLDILMFIEIPTGAATKAMTLFLIYASGTDWGRESFANLPPEILAEFADFAQAPKDVLHGLIRQGR